MDAKEYFKEQFDQLQHRKPDSHLNFLRKDAFDFFSKVGIPTTRNEEWKYTRIGSLFNKDFRFNENTAISSEDLDAVRLPGFETADELVFVNGFFSEALSVIRSKEVIILPLEQAASMNEYQEIVLKNFNHSSKFAKDGINALNTALVQGGVFIYVKPKHSAEHPVYIYNISDARSGNNFAQPRSLMYLAEGSYLRIAETYRTLGAGDSFTNQVIEMVVEKDAHLEYYKIQNDHSNASQVSTTHIRQTGKSLVNTVTITLNGHIVRNNLNMIMEASNSEAHLYGLYFPKGRTHVDNHTLVDNAVPDCQSFQLYKGILDEESTGVFNGKVMVRQIAQKTNAYQSNKNILLSDSASINAKPQLEIFADDVKCSHGCTVGRLDEEALFYLESRGISKSSAVSLLLHAFAVDVLEKIESEPIRKYAEKLIDESLGFNW